MNGKSVKSALALDSGLRDLCRLSLNVLEGGYRKHLVSSMSLVSIRHVLLQHYSKYRPDHPR